MQEMEENRQGKWLHCLPGLLLFIPGSRLFSENGLFGSWRFQWVPPSGRGVLPDQEIPIGVRLGPCLFAFPPVPCYFIYQNPAQLPERKTFMSPELHITILEKPDDAAWEVIGGGISAFNLGHAGSDAATPLCIVLRDEAGQTLGGADRRYLLRLAVRQPHVRPRGPARAGVWAKSCSSARRRKPAGAA